MSSDTSPGFTVIRNDFCRSISSLPSRTSPAAELDEVTLRQLLTALQRKLSKARNGAKSTLVVHGGVVSVLLHKSRLTTNDIDYIGRTVYEDIEEEALAGDKLDDGEIGDANNKQDWKKFFTRLQGRASLGPAGTNLLIRVCVEETTCEYNADVRNEKKLRLDWMNCTADVALPWSLTKDNLMFDPLVYSAVHSPLARTVFDSPGLKLVSLPWPWLIALKLQRDTPRDRTDISAILTFESLTNNADDASLVEYVIETIKNDCPVFEFDRFPERIKEEWRSKLKTCVRIARERLEFGALGPEHGQQTDEYSVVPM